MTAAPSHPAALPDVQGLEAIGDPASRIILSCERAKEWLAAALASDDIEQIVEMKSQAEAIRVYTMQKQLGKDAALSASEIVRRAENCIGLAIRKGQEEGRIAKRGEVGGSPGNSRSLRSGDLLKPSDIATEHELEMAYLVSDGISSEAFEAAITEAKLEGNLSRANVVRKLRGEGGPGRWARLAELAAEGHTSSQIAQEIGVTRHSVVAAAKRFSVDIPADRVVGKMRLIDHDRVIRAFADTLESLVPSCDEIDPAKINRAVLEECLSIIDDAARAINRLRTRLRKRG